MRLRLALPTLALALATLASAAAAEVTPIPADAQKPFKHELSGISMPATAAAIPRTVVEEFDDKQLDVAAEYRTPDQKEITTIYVFRQVTGDVPLWFDRIQREIEARDMFMSPRIAIAPTAFTPPGQRNASGLIAVYAPGGQTWKSTGAALASTGDWFVSVRASSQTLTPQQLLVRIQETLASIQWPRTQAAMPAAVPVSPCGRPLAAAAEDAKPINDDLAAILVEAAAGAESKDRKSAAADPSHWCRDPMSLPYAGVYRPDGAQDRYLIAFQDAGRGMWVGPNSMADLLAKSQGNDRTSYMVELIEIDRHVGLGSFATLPPVAQAVWLNEHGTPRFSTSTWGKNRNINLNSDVVK